jgi:hypothetical protein
LLGKTINSQAEKRNIDDQSRGLKLDNIVDDGPAFIRHVGIYYIITQRAERPDTKNN